MRTLLFVLFLMVSLPVFPQADTVSHPLFGVAYFPQGGVHPGLALSYERRMAGTDRFQFLMGAKIGMYYHYRNNTGVFIMAQSGQRYRIYKRLYAEHFIGIGYLHSFLNGGDAYYVTASGQIQKASRAGDPHFMPSFSFGPSYRLGDHARIFLRPMIYWVIPFNQRALVQYAWEAGASFRIKR